jgi:hypothetical protein
MPVSQNKSDPSELTVTCHQCGGSSMVRLDRNEYKCTHCGAITIVSDNDADRLEQMLTNVLNRPGATNSAPISPVPNPAAARILLVVFAAVIILVVTWNILVPGSHHSSTSSYDDAEHTVPPSQVVLSPLKPTVGIAGNDSYTGIIYNRSDYPIEVPRYTITYFKNDLKLGSDFSISPIDTLLPGEYVPIKFDDIEAGSNHRYEIQGPDTVSRSQRELVSLPLQQIQFVHRAGDNQYSLIGVVTNTFGKPITGDGELFLYGQNQELIATATTSFGELRPGEKTSISLDVYPTKNDAPISSYEYMIDAYYTGSR